jgi:hypothetical protein
VVGTVVAGSPAVLDEESETEGFAAICAACVPASGDDRARGDVGMEDCEFAEGDCSALAGTVCAIVAASEGDVVGTSVSCA